MGRSEFGCATEVAMDVLGGKWTVVILAHLKQGDQRYSQLWHAIPGISEKVLSDRLRMLVEEGLVERESIPAAPPQVVYRLNEQGLTLIPALDALHTWGATWAQQHDYITLH